MRRARTLLADLGSNDTHLTGAACRPLRKIEKRSLICSRTFSTEFAGLSGGGRWIRTIGPWRHAVGSVMENVDNLAEPAGRLPQSTTLRGCYVPALVKGSMAWLLCLPVGQALPLASSCRSTLFFFRRGTNGSNPFPSSWESATNRELQRTKPPPEGPIDAMGRATRNGNFVAACNDGVPQCPS
jgi:hypothetical protein